jgi:murein DD-endopeptidase MepM/ murein hydrolase activator NlpD
MAMVSESKYHSAFYLFLFIVIFFFIGDLYAEKLYEYRDENGVLHFSNIPPNTRLPVKVQQVRVSGVENRVFVKNAGSEETPMITVYSEYGGPIEMEFSLLEGGNISSNPQFPFRRVIPPNEEIETVRMWPTRKNQSWSYRYSYRYCPGDPSATHSPDKPYRPPIPAGSAYPVSQAFNGTYSHQSAQSRYAIDIAVPIGTPVCAARSGVVMDIANDFFTGGTDREDYSRRANFIRILHDDGTMALYAHLKVETVRVGIGWQVSEGEVIAESGDTGYSSGPHLHFVVQRNTGMQLISLPFKIDLNGHGVTPQKDMLLRAN